MNEQTLLELPPLPRGRPSKEILQERARLARIIAENRKRLFAEAVPVAVDGVSYDQTVLEEIQYRFGMLNRYALASAAGEIRCLVAHGSGGIGKSFELMQTLDAEIPGKYEVVEGAEITPIQLFMIAYRNREAGKVIVFDDSDSWITGGKEELLNILKKMTDTSPVRRMTYLKSSKILEDEGIPNEFVFEGTVIFLSNIDFEKLADGNDRRAHHVQAIITRSLVLDLRIHVIRSKYVWVRYRAVTALLPSLKATPEEAEIVLAFLDKNYEKFKALSLRSVGYLVTIIRRQPDSWQKDAEIMLLR